MTIRILATCGMVIAGLATAVADEVSGSGFSSGKWTGAAYTDEGIFSHCAMGADYQSGIRLHFAIDKAYRWRLGLSHPEWKMAPGESIPITYQVDRYGANTSDARVLSEDFLIAELVATDRVFNQFRRGKMLTIQAGSQNYSFVLTGTSRALSSTLKCVERYSDHRDRTAPAPEASGVPTASWTMEGTMPTDIPTRAPEPSRSEASNVPQAPAAPASSASADTRPTTQTASLDLPDRSDTERRTASSSASPVLLDAPEPTLDAVRYMIRMFRSDDFADYRFLDHTASANEGANFGPAAIAWTSPGGTGALKVYEAGSAQPDGVIAEAIAADARQCRGSFASGKKPAEEDPAISTAFTACKDGDVYEFYRDYLAFRHEAGNLYLVSGNQSGTSPVVDTMPGLFARNIAAAAQ